MLCVAGLTEWRICASMKYGNIGSNYGLSSGRRQTIIWTNAGLLSIETLRTNPSEIVIEIQNIVWKMVAVLFRPQCVKRLNIYRYKNDHSDTPIYDHSDNPIYEVKSLAIKRHSLYKLQLLNDEPAISLRISRNNIAARSIQLLRKLNIKPSGRSINISSPSTNHLLLLLLHQFCLPYFQLYEWIILA